MQYGEILVPPPRVEPTPPVIKRQNFKPVGHQGSSLFHLNLNSPMWPVAAILDCINRTSRSDFLNYK